MKRWMMVLLSPLLFAAAAPAQTMESVWSSIYIDPGTEQGFCMALTPSGSVILAGERNSQGAIFEFQPDGTGALVWESTESGDRIDDILIDPDGGYIVLSQQGNGDDAEVRLRRVGAPSGNWSHVYERALFDDPLTLRALPDGGYLILVEAAVELPLLSGIRLIRTDSAGEIVWDELYTSTDIAHQQQPEDLLVLPDGNYLIAGGSSNDTGLLMWVDSAGDSLQTLEVPTSLDGVGAVKFVAVCLLTSGHVGFAGTANVSGAGYAWYGKLTTGGQIEVEGVDEIGQYPEGISPATDGGFFVASIANDWGSDGYLFRVSPAGVVTWEDHYGDPTWFDQFRDCLTTPEGDVYAGGLTFSLTTITDFWMMRFTESESSGPPTLSISATVQSAAAGLLADENAIAALDPEATDGYDAGIDIPKPAPPASDFLSVSFPHPEWSVPTGPDFMVDARNGNDDLSEALKRWTFEVATDQVDSTVNLEFTLADIPAEYNVTLYNIATGESHDLGADPN
ncbi:MAG TPA: WD40 repeat domain-containing protein, partial [Bacteroidetes bacterium]|nr:WD40 repeat domain-containing protein [Bacteroidota bacterium]